MNQQDESQERSAMIDQVALDFERCRKVLTAIGDESRLGMIIAMMKLKKCAGARVGEITEATRLSRPAVSHHLQILKDAGIVKVRKDGTMNYYYFDTDATALEALIAVLTKAAGVVKMGQTDELAH